MLRNLGWSHLSSARRSAHENLAFWIVTTRQNRGADSQQNAFHCISANLYPFLMLVPYFFQEFFELFKNEKVSNFHGLKCKFQQHFLRGKSKNKPKSNFEFLGGKKTKFYFFFAHFQKVQNISEKSRV